MGARPAAGAGGLLPANFRAYLSLSAFYDLIPILCRVATSRNLQPVAMRIFWIAACVTGLCVCSATAQTVLRKDPAVYAVQDRTSRVEVRPPGIRLGLRKPREVALAPLSG